MSAERSIPEVRKRARVRHLFQNWAHVERRLRKAKHVALFLDFDGTLVPLQSHFDEIRLDAPTRNLLRRLARLPRVLVCVISGRRGADLRKRVNVAGAYYLGLHGWERNGRRPTVPTGPLINSVRRLLASRLAGLRNIRIRDKGISFDIHYRSASSAATRKARAEMRRIIGPLEPRIRVLHGKKIWEVLPQEIEGKGPAVRAVLAKFPHPALPIYIGDDTSDESAFQALPKGITVRVGRPRRTLARFELRNPMEVSSFLQRVEDKIA